MGRSPCSSQNLVQGFIHPARVKGWIALLFDPFYKVQQKVSLWLYVQARQIPRVAQSQYGVKHLLLHCPRHHNRTGSHQRDEFLQAFADDHQVVAQRRTNLDTEASQESERLACPHTKHLVHSALCGAAARTNGKAIERAARVSRFMLRCMYQSDL